MPSPAPLSPPARWRPGESVLAPHEGRQAAGRILGPHLRPNGEPTGLTVVVLDDAPVLVVNPQYLQRLAPLRGLDPASAVGDALPHRSASPSQETSLLFLPPRLAHLPPLARTYLLSVAERWDVLMLGLVIALAITGNTPLLAFTALAFALSALTASTFGDAGNSAPLVLRRVMTVALDVIVAVWAADTLTGAWWFLDAGLLTAAFYNLLLLLSTLRPAAPSLATDETT